MMGGGWRVAAVAVVILVVRGRTWARVRAHLIVIVPLVALPVAQAVWVR